MLFKKIILILIIIVSVQGYLVAQDLSMTNDRWRTEDAANKFRFTYNIGINAAMHAYAEKTFEINDMISLSYGGVLSSANDIGTTFERPDMPLFKTGRFYQGEISLHLNKFNIHLGRHLYDQDPIEQKSIWNSGRITGDGLVWSWDITDRWRFENSIEALPSDKDIHNQVFDRILNYHSFIWKNDKLEMSLGELCLYTGIGQGINIQYSNPFLPYLLHMVDGFDRYSDGYNGDNENSMILIGFKWSILSDLTYRTYFYIDDIQIDAADRQLVADMYLWYNKLSFSPNKNFRSSIQFSLSNPAFGWHNGAFTSFDVYNYELLPHQLGEIYSLSANMNYRLNKFETYVKAYMVHKAILDPSLGNLFLHEVQNNLEKVSVYGIDIKAGWYILDNLALWAHLNVSSENETVYNFILQTYF